MTAAPPVARSLRAATAAMAAIVLMATAAVASAAEAKAKPLQSSTPAPSTVGRLSLLEPVVLSAPEEAAPAAEAAPAETSTEDWLVWPSVSVDASFYNKYVWRGILLTDGPVFEPSITVEWNGFSVNVWGNLDLDDVNGLEGEFNEVDWTVGYEHEIVGPLSGSVGMIVYEFPNTAFATTAEAYVGLSLDVPLSPSLTAYFDVDETDGVYVLASVGHSFELPKFCENVSASLDLGAGFGWGSAKNNFAYYGVKSPGFTDYYVSLGMPIAIGDHVTVTPNIKYTGLLDDDLRTGVVKDDNVIYGVSITVSF